MVFLTSCTFSGRLDSSRNILLFSHSCPILCDTMDCSTPGFPVHQQLPELAQTHVHRVGDAIQTSHPLSPSSPPALNLFQNQGLFQWINSSHRVENTGASTSASVLPMNIQGWFPLGLTGLISLQSKWLSRVFSITVQNHLQRSAFFTVQLSHLYMTTGKTTALTLQTFVGKVISLLFNMLSRFVIAFLSRSKCLLISWLQSLSTVILEPKKIKSVTVSVVSPSICHEAMGPGRRRWHPTPVLLPGESHGWRSLAGYSPWGR